MEEGDVERKEGRRASGTEEIMLEGGGGSFVSRSEHFMSTCSTDFACKNWFKVILPLRVEGCTQ